MVKDKNNTQEVDDFMRKLKHPFKTEVEIVRKIIKGVNKKITEEIKWNAPSFSYGDYIATFNLHEKKRVHLVFHNPLIVYIKNNLLEGDYRDRRMIYFDDKKDIASKKSEFVRILKSLLAMMDAMTGTLTGDLPNIGRPARQALATIRITELSQITRMTEEKLLELHGMGPKAIRILKEALKAKGISFKK